jgi:hypothetical protein
MKFWSDRTTRKWNFSDALSLWGREPSRRQQKYFESGYASARVDWVSLICDLFEEGYERIYFDGTNVAIRLKSVSGPTEWDLELLKQLSDASTPLEDDVPSRFADPFLWKALVVEGVIWSLLGYSPLRQHSGEQIALQRRR